MIVNDTETPGHRIIGSFRLVRSLGIGSSGEVFLAERIESFPQRVAIKVMPAVAERATMTTAALDEVDVAAGVHEATVLVALDHPHIVKLVDHGVLPDGQRYLVMEYVEGVPIDRYCMDHRLTPRERVQLLIKVMDALSHTHRHLIIHADLKPANILVMADGEPKLLDFGVAQWRGTAGPEGFTPAFASPEQTAGARLSAASDIFSLGVIADKVLEGERGRDLDAILATATAHVVEERYASIDAFKADLSSYLDGRNVSVRNLSRLGSTLRWVKRHRLYSLISLGIFLTLAAAAVGVVRNAAQAARQRTLAEFQLHELVTLTGTLEGDLYDSVRSLPQSADARKILLQGASATLATLASHDNKDSILALELVHQYETLARLLLAEVAISTEPTAATRDALRALDAGSRLLSAIDRADPQYSAAQHDQSIIGELRNAIGRRDTLGR